MVVVELSCVPQSEWEALEVLEHHWALESVEEDLMSRDLNLESLFSKELQATMF